MTKQQAVEIARECGLHIQVLNLIDAGIPPLKTLKMLNII